MSGVRAEQLSTKRRLYLDSMIFIYFMEDREPYAPLLEPVFARIGSNGSTALSSYLTLLEVLVQPLQTGNRELADRYRRVLLDSEDFHLFPVDRAIAERAAAIRAEYSIRTPDALQLATAQVRGADAFLTNDRDLQKFREIEVVVLDDLVSDEPSGEP